MGTGCEERNIIVCVFTRRDLLPLLMESSLCTEDGEARSLAFLGLCYHTDLTNAVPMTGRAPDFITVPSICVLACPPACMFMQRQQNSPNP